MRCLAEHSVNVNRSAADALDPPVADAAAGAGAPLMMALH